MAKGRKPAAPNTSAGRTKGEKFPLDMGSGVLVRDLDELKEHYSSEAVINYFLNGKLLTWLNDRYYEDEAEQVKELDAKGRAWTTADIVAESAVGGLLAANFVLDMMNTAYDTNIPTVNVSARPEKKAEAKENTDKELRSSQGKYFKASFLDTELKIIFGLILREDVDPLAIARKERVERLRKFTDNEEILKNADRTAFSQEELGDLLDDGAETVYLCGEKFRIPLGVGGVMYIGVNRPIITVGGKKEIDFENNEIEFIDCEFSEDVLKRLCKADRQRYIEGVVPIKATAVKEEDVSENEDTSESDYATDDDFEFNVEKGWVTISNYTGSARIIEITDVVNEIDDNTFEGCSAEKIVVPDSVEKIGESAFADCKKLKEIILSDNLTELGCQAFSGCTSLTSINVPEGVTDLDYDTFCGCTKLKSVDLPYSLETIYESVFSGCTSLESIDIPAVKSIGENVFSGCTNLKRVSLPDEIESLGDNGEDSDVFDGCSKVIVEYDGKEYRYGQLRSLYIKINCR